MAKTPEGDLKSKLVDCMVALGGVVEPLMTGLTGAGRRRYSTPNRSLGRPDLLWLYRGVPIAVEVKAGTKQRPSQIEWESKWVTAGGRYWIVDSVTALLKFHQKLETCLNGRPS